VRKGDDLTTFIVPKVEKIPKGLLRPVAGKLLPSLYSSHGAFRYQGVPVTTAWRVLSLRMEERPPDMEGSCEYTE
jgi:hypothetical protein